MECSFHSSPKTKCYHRGEVDESETENRAGEEVEKGVLVENNGSEDHLPENLAKYYERFLH